MMDLVSVGTLEESAQMSTAPSASLSLHEQNNNILVIGFENLSKN